MTILYSFILNSLSSSICRKTVVSGMYELDRRTEIEAHHMYGRGCYWTNSLFRFREIRLGPDSGLAGGAVKGL